MKKDALVILLHERDVEAVATANTKIHSLSDRVADLTARLESTSREHGELLAVYHQARRHLMALLTDEDAANAISATRRTYLADELRRQKDIQRGMEAQQEELNRHEAQRNQYRALEGTASAPENLDRLIEETEGVIARLKSEIQRKQSQIAELEGSTRVLQETIDNSCYSKYALKHLRDTEKNDQAYVEALLCLAHNWNCSRNERLEEDDLSKLTLIELFDLRLGGRDQTKRTLVVIGCSEKVIRYFEDTTRFNHVLRQRADAMSRATQNISVNF
jgi:hypothetical protein